MKIETKFDCGQHVFILFTDKVYRVKIKDISISVIEGIMNSPKYTMYDNPAGSSYTKTFHESELFKTKQDLLDSL